MLFEAIAMVVLFVMERLRPARRERGDTERNLMIWAFNTALNFLVFGAVGAAEKHWLEIAHIPHIDISAMPFVLGAAIYLVTADFAAYALHRLQHAVPALWRIHSLHHSDECMGVATTRRHHWCVMLFDTLITTPVLAILLHPTYAHLLVFYLASLWVYVCHANIDLQLGPLNYVFNSPNNHRIHHSREPEHYDVNFANIFSFWDVLGGAYLDPRRPLPQTGLDVRPRHIGEALIWPFLKASVG